MNTSFVKLEDKMDQGRQATACCRCLSLKQGVQLGCAYYVLRALLNVVLPLIAMSRGPRSTCVFAHPSPGCPNFCSGPGALCAGETLAQCGPPKGQVPAQFTPEMLEKQPHPPCYPRMMQQMMGTEEICLAHNGTWEQIRPDQDGASSSSPPPKLARTRKGAAAQTRLGLKLWCTSSSSRWRSSRSACWPCSRFSPP